LKASAADIYSIQEGQDMAKFIGAIGTSHSPPMFLDAQYWENHAKITDFNNPELLSPRTGKVTPYLDLVKEVEVHNPALLAQLNPQDYAAKFERLQAGAQRLRQILADHKPDVVLVVSDDQEELFFDDNMPALSIYWGESWTLYPWKSHRPGAHPLFQQFQRGWGDLELSVPVDAAMGEYLVTELTRNNFDIAHFRYLREEYGGSVGPSGYIEARRSREPIRKGVPHGFAYVVKAVMDNQPIPMVPVFVNTCYPPNRPTGRRCFDFGEALRKLVEAYPGDQRVLMVASGGLSHFVLDEELDRLVIKGLETGDRNILENLPRLDTPTGEIRNWIVVAGACQDRRFELIDYVPTARSPGGTGGGWTFGQWI
jgi:3-O-methylgallate 3,4-dioxygenase